MGGPRSIKPLVTEERATKKNSTEKKDWLFTDFTTCTHCLVEKLANLVIRSITLVNDTLFLQLKAFYSLNPNEMILY